ncbi:MAG TPA: hypothetical protein VGB17_15645 [Pyrinomonadaceae bacterium]|jgi:hypothetical protein
MGIVEQQEEISPELEALIDAVDALRENAASLEDSDGTYGGHLKHLSLSRDELGRQHGRAAAKRELANRLELEARSVCAKEQTQKGRSNKK